MLEVADTNESAVALYEKLGFWKIHPVKEKHPKQSGINYLLYIQYDKAQTDHERVFRRRAEVELTVFAAFILFFLRFLLKYGTIMIRIRQMLGETDRMRRKDRERETEFALSVVDTCSFAVLSLVRQDGTPYSVPLHVVRLGDVIYFHCAQEGEKIDCMRRHPQVCLSCVGAVHFPPGEFTTSYESATVFGTAFEICQAEEKRKILWALCLRYTPDNMANFDREAEASLSHTGIWGIRIARITGKQRR